MIEFEYDQLIELCQRWRQRAKQAEEAMDVNTAFGADLHDCADDLKALLLGIAPEAAPVVAEPGVGGPILVHFEWRDGFDTWESAGAELASVPQHGHTVMLEGQPYHPVNIIWYPISAEEEPPRVEVTLASGAAPGWRAFPEPTELTNTVLAEVLRVLKQQQQ